MADSRGNVFPAYIRAEYQQGPAFERFESAMDQSAKRARSKFDQTFSSIDRTITDALSRATTATGSLDLGVKQANDAAAAATRRADALKEVARAARAAADAERNVPRLDLQAKAAAALAVESRQAAREAAQHALALDRLQVELDQSVTSYSRFAAAQRGSASASAGSRQAFVQTGQQLQDLGISLYSGQRASVVFAQQLPQLAFALTSLEGSTNKTQNAIGKFAGVLSGPVWSIALVAGAAAVGFLVEKLFFAEKQSDKTSQSVEQIANSLNFATSASRELAKATGELVAAQEKQLQSGYATEKQSLKTAEGYITQALAAREALETELKLAEATFNRVNAQGGKAAQEFAAGLTFTISNLEEQLKANQTAIDNLRNFESLKAVPILRRQAEALTDPSKAADLEYEKQEDRARARLQKDRSAAKTQAEKLAAEKRYTDELVKQDAIRDKASKKDRAARADPSLSPTKKVSLASPQDIVDNFVRISSGFGQRNSPTKGATTNHLGLDIAAPGGSNVRAAQVGTVELVGYDKGIGKYVVIDHGAGTKTRYGHLSNNSVVKPGDRVDRGDVIGNVGSTGVSTGNHLHLEAILNAKFNAQGKLLSGRKVDPRKALPVNDAEASSDAQRNIDTQTKAASVFGEKLKEIDLTTQRITGEFDDQPKLIDRINITTLKLRQTTERIDRDLAAGNLTAEQRLELETRKLEVIKSQALVSGFVQKQLQTETDDFNQRIQIQKLMLSGREEEAKILERITQKSKKYGLDETLDKTRDLLKENREILAMEDSSTAEKEAATAVIAKQLPIYEAALKLLGEITGESKRQVEIETQLEQIGQRILRQRQAYASYIDSTYSSLENLLSGGKAKDFFKELSGGFKQLQGTLLTDKLFGGAFDELRRFNNRRSPENIAISNYVEQVDKGSSAILSHADALVNATVRINGAANDNTAIGSAASTAALAAARVSGSGITVDGNKSAPIRLANESVTDFVTRLSSAIVIPFTTELDKVFGTKFFGGLSGVLSGALSGFARAGKVGAVLGGAQGFAELFAKRDSKTGIAGNKIFGKISDTLGKVLGGAETGSQIAGILKAVGIGSSRTGGAIGGAAGSLFGPIGEFLGGTIGSIVGGLFKKTKKADLTVTNSSVSATGTKSLLGGLNSGGGGIQDRIKAIAQQLNGSVGDFSLAIKQKGKKFLFGGKKFDDFESAAEAALLSAIQNGAVKGISAGAQKLLKAGTDLDRQLQKALSFQGVFDRLKEIDDPVGAALDRLDREFTNLKSIFAEAGASASEYADLQRLYDMDRAKAIEEANSRITASLKSLYADLTINNDALSLRDRQSAAKAVYDPLAARVAAGDKTAYDAYADAAKSLLDIERSLYGSQSGYFDRLSEVTNLTKARIDEESNVTSIDRLGLTFSNEIQTQTQTLTNAIAQGNALLSAMNTNMGTLIEQGFGAGRPLAEYATVRNF